MAYRSRILGVLLLAALAVTAQTFGFALRSAPQPCLAIGNTGYRLAHGGADVTVRIVAPDIATIRVRLAATPDEADFVFVDDGTTPACEGVTVKRVRIDTAAGDISLALEGASEPDYRIYVRSSWMAAETAAALFAAAHAPARKLARADNAK